MQNVKQQGLRVQDEIERDFQSQDENRKEKRATDNTMWVLLQHARSLATRARDLELAQFDLTIEQMSIMHVLMMKDGSATVDEIAGITVRQYNSVTTLVNRMVNLGLLKKEKFTHEKRCRILLTEKGRQLVKMVPHKSIDMIFSDFSLEEKEQFGAFLKRMIGTGREMLGTEYVPPFLVKKD